MSAHSEAMSQDEENQGVDEEYSLHSFLDISKKKQKTDHLDDEDDEQKTKSKRRSQKYRRAWESNPDFAPWIQPVESDAMSAQCSLCSNVMRAEITVLRRHCTSVKHLKNAEAAELGESNVSFHYRKEWEKNKHYMHWVARVENNENEAYCTVCRVRINANTSELRLHSRSETHLRRVAGFNDSDSDGEEQVEAKPKPTPTRAKRGSSFVNSEFDPSTANVLDLDEIVIDTKLSDLSIAEDKSTLFDENSETPIRVYRVKPSEISMPGTTSPFPPSKGTNEEEISQALVTQLAPSWKGKAVVNGHVQDLKLSDYRGRYVVMFFYPQDFSTVCSTEILALGDVISAFRVINCEVVAVSVDSHLAHLAWTKTLASSAGSNNRPEAPKLVPLLSDSTHSISRSYGCYLPSAGHSLRAYYIIDKRGVLRAMNISDIQVGRNLKEILRLVEAFQLVDSTNTQCPVNWTTGQPSVKVAL